MSAVPPPDRQPDPPAPRRGKPRLWRVVVVAVACWIALAVIYFFLPRLLTRMWIFALLPLGAAWLGAAAASVAAVVLLARRRGVVPAVSALAVTIALAAGVLLCDWRDAYAHGWFATHRTDFNAARDLARSGKLGPVEGWDYYGVELPPPLRGLSVNGRISSIGKAAGRPVLFIPAYIGTPDDAFGFGYLSGPPETMLDGFGDPLQPRIELGDGWWWLD